MSIPPDPFFTENYFYIKTTGKDDVLKIEKRDLEKEDTLRNVFGDRRTLWQWIKGSVGTSTYTYGLDSVITRINTRIAKWNTDQMNDSLAKINRNTGSDKPEQITKENLPEKIGKVINLKALKEGEREKVIDRIQKKFPW